MSDPTYFPVWVNLSKLIPFPFVSLNHGVPTKFPIFIDMETSGKAFSSINDFSYNPTK
jgi:hypothetical protein